MVDQGSLGREFGEVLRRWGLLDEVNDPKAAEEFAVTDLLSAVSGEIERLRERHKASLRRADSEPNHGAVLLEAAKALERRFGVTPATVELRLMSTKAQQHQPAPGEADPIIAYRAPVSGNLHCAPCGESDRSTALTSEDLPDGGVCVGCGADVLIQAEPEDQPEDRPCAATFREEPMPDTVYCGERGYHQRHTSGSGSQYYTWMDGDEGAGWDR